MSREQIDKLINKWISRKLLVFICASAFLIAGLITRIEWASIAGIYLGAETFLNRPLQ
jgi:hypothetical protein